MLINHLRLNERINMFLNTDQKATHDLETDDRQLALEYLAEAWSNAEQDGIEGEAIAHAAIFAALATLIRSFGEEATADLLENLPKRVLHGEYTLDRSIQ
jgi:hypothetical protein